MNGKEEQLLKVFMMVNYVIMEYFEKGLLPGEAAYGHIFVARSYIENILDSRVDQSLIDNCMNHLNMFSRS